MTNQEAPQINGAVGIKHCHDNSHAQEDREREKKVARKRLYVASVICLIFMIGEILGESLCFLTFFHLKSLNPLSLPLFFFFDTFRGCLHLALKCVTGDLIASGQL